MPVTIIELILQIACMLHIIRTGRDRMWIYLSFVPIIGPVVYGVVEVLPELLRSYRGQQLTRAAVMKIDPERNIRKHHTRLEIADTVENRRLLAEEYFRTGRVEDAAAIYREITTGVHADDAALLMGLAKCEVMVGRPASVLQTLDRLRAANPNFQSNDAHLMYARALEGLGRDEEAASEYATLVHRFPGDEARCRYAMLVQRNGDNAQAREVFDEIVARSRHASRRYMSTEREWIETARKMTENRP